MLKKALAVAQKMFLLGSHLRPARQGWALQMKEEKHAPKEALDATAFAKRFFSMVPLRFHYGCVTLPAYLKNERTRSSRLQKE